jgi:hypothetical protein
MWETPLLRKNEVYWQVYGKALPRPSIERQRNKRSNDARNALDTCDVTVHMGINFKFWNGGSSLRLQPRCV